MPIYEFRCPECGHVTSALLKLGAQREAHPCEACGAGAQAVLSSPSVHLSRQSKVEKLDPKYDRMVDQAMRNTQHAEPDRLLKKLKPFPKS